jgi:prophage regulatory protein
MQNISPIEQIFLTREDLRSLGIRVSNTTLLRWESLRRFPKRARFANTTVAWFRYEVLQWIQDRDDERASYVYGDS